MNHSIFKVFIFGILLLFSIPKLQCQEGYMGNMAQSDLFLYNLEQFMLSHAKQCDIDYVGTFGEWERKSLGDMNEPCQMLVNYPYLDPYEQYLYHFVYDKEAFNLLYQTVHKPFDIRKLRAKTKGDYGLVKKRINEFPGDEAIYVSHGKIWRMEYDFDKGTMNIYPKPLRFGLSRVSSRSPVYHLSMGASSFMIDLINAKEVIAIPLSMDLAEKVHKGDVQIVVTYSPVLKMSKSVGAAFEAKAKKMEFYVKEGQGIKFGEVQF